MSALLAGLADDFRRASPSLTAVCMFSEFAQGLECAAGTVTSPDISANNAGRWGSTGVVEDNQGVDNVAENQVVGVGAAGRGGGVPEGLGLSKAEFCEYFQAITDLVDLNGLSLLPKVYDSCSSSTSSSSATGILQQPVAP